MTALLVAALVQYHNEPFVLDGIRSTARRVRFEKIFSDGHMEQADKSVPVEKVARWLDERGFVRCGCLVGEDEDLGVIWILAAEFARGKTPESYGAVVGQRLQSATVAFYPSDGERPAHLETQVSGWAIKRARSRNPYEQRDLGVEVIDPDRRLRTYGLV